MLANLFTLMHIIVTIIVAILLPGFLFARALFSVNQRHNTAQQIAISGSLGLILTVLIGTFLIEAKIGFTKSTYFAALGLVCVLSSAVWIYRIQDQFPLNLNRLIPAKRTQPVNLIPQTIILVILLSIIFAVAAILPSHSSGNDKFTEFYITNKAQIIPFDVTNNSRFAINATIVHHGSRGDTYKLQVTNNGDILYESRDVYIKADEKHNEEFIINIKEVDSNLPIYILLIKNDNVRPYRSLRLSSFEG